MPADKPAYPDNTRHGRHAPSSTEATLVAVGVITGAHGIRGQVKLRSFTDDPYDITEYGALMNASGSKRFDIRIDGENKGGLFATIQGVKDRNAAELLRGTELFVDKANIPPADEDEFFYDDLIGLEVRDSNGENIAKVAAMYNFGAGDIIELHMAGRGKEMYPFTKQNFPEVHVSEGYVLAELPEIVDTPKKDRQ